MRRLIEIVPYNPAWPAAYEAEKAAILAAIGRHLDGIEHIGSTAVPGLGAKPVIDIMAGVRSLAEATQCVAPLQALGYEYVPAFEAVMPERRYFRKDTAGKRSHQIHMVEPTDPFWERHLLFRDFLRTHPEALEDYQALKQDLAARHIDDIDAYTDGKTAFIQDIEARARVLKETR